MTQFKTLAALAEDPGVVPSIHMATHNCLSTTVPEDQMPSSSFHGHQEHEELIQ